MSDQALAIRDDSRMTFSYNAEAERIKSEALAASALIGKVTNADEQAVAVKAQQKLTEIKRLAEKARVAATEPVLAFQRHIMAQFKAFIAEPSEEELRIAKLNGDFIQLEQARVRAAEQVRLAEERRLQEERRQAEQKATDEAAAARRKLDDEAAAIARKASEAKNAEQRAKAEQERLELERQRALAEAKSHDELDRINASHAEAVAALPVETIQKAAGQRVVQSWDITVTDIWLLARAHPGCVKIEARLTEIKSLLDAGVKVAGVIAKRETKSGVGSTRERAAIEV